MQGWVAGHLGLAVLLEADKLGVDRLLGQAIDEVVEIVVLGDHDPPDQVLETLLN